MAPLARPARADVFAGLVTRLTFDEGSGTVAGDATGNGHGADLYGPAWTAGRIGGALEFDGSGYIEDSDAEGYLTGLAAVTVTVWVKSDVSGQDRGIFFTRAPTGRDQELGLRYDAAGWGGGATSDIKASVRTDQDYTQVETLSNQQTTEWQFLALVWESGATITLYVNAVPVATTYDEGPISGTLAGMDRLTIGRDTKNRYWDGLIDDFRVYDRALSEPEIIEIYGAGGGGLVAEYPLDEGAGQVAGDSSGGGHDGTLGSDPGIDANDPAWVPAGKCAAALEFDGVDDFVVVPHDDAFLIDAGTIACWFMTRAASQTQGVIAKDSRNFDTGGHFRIFIRGNKLRVQLQSTTASYNLQSGNLADNTWYHVAFTFGPGGMTLYLDGVAVDTNPYMGGLGGASGGAGNHEPLVFGVDQSRSGDLTWAGWDRPLSGWIDEVRIYDRPLLPEELPGVMQCQAPPPVHRITRWREVTR